jgi:hypothetical protein
MKNLDIRMRIKEYRLCHYEVAAQIGVSEYTLCRWLREELSAEKKEAVNKAIDYIIGKGR